MNSHNQDVDIINFSDEVFQRRINYNSKYVFIGDLLESISKQIGVRVFAEDRDFAAGLGLTVYLTDVPSGDVLNSLVSLLSLQKSDWKWVRSANGYRLTRSVRSKNATAESMAKLIREMAQATEEALKLVDAPLETLKEEGKKNHEIRYLSSDESSRKSASAFALLPPDVRYSLLTGKTKSLSLELDKTSPEFSRLVKSTAIKQLPNIDRVEYKFEFFPAGLTPSLIFMRGDQNIRLGFPVMGGTDNELDRRREFGNAWLQGQIDSSSLPDVESVPLENKETEGNVFPASTKLIQAAKAHRTNLIARLPIHQGNIRITPTDSLKKINDDLVGNGIFSTYKQPIWKAYSPVCVAEEFATEYIPYSVRKELKSIFRKPSNILELEDLARISALLTDSGLEIIQSEKNPEYPTGLQMIFDEVRGNRALLSFLQEDKSAIDKLKKEGIPIASLKKNIQSLFLQSYPTRQGQGILKLKKETRNEHILYEFVVEIENLKKPVVWISLDPLYPVRDLTPRRGG
jgi:hypothetical protein